MVQSADLKTFQEVVDRATLVKRGAAITRVRREAFDRNKDKKRSFSHPEGGQQSGSRLPKHPRSQPGTRSAQMGGQRQGDRPRFICGGAHMVTACSKQHDHCFRCGKLEHFQSNCPLNPGAASSVASTLVPQRQSRGRSLSVAAGRPSMSH